VTREQWLAKAHQLYMAKFDPRKEGRLSMALFDGGMAVFQSLRDALKDVGPLEDETPSPPVDEADEFDELCRVDEDLACPPE